MAIISGNAGYLCVLERLSPVTIKQDYYVIFTFSHGIGFVRFSHGHKMNSHDTGLNIEVSY